MRTQSVVKSISLENLSLPSGKVQFDIDQECSRIFIGDSAGSGKVGQFNEGFRFVSIDSEVKG